MIESNPGKTVTMASSSKVGGDEAYANDARYQIVLLLQRSILSKQVARLETLITESVDAQDANSKMDVRDKLPSTSFDEIIQKRFQSASDVLPANRVLDDLEISLLGILDSDSRIALMSKLSEFTVLMTRATTMDQRALCMYLIEHCLTDSCQKQFVSEGGYRILKTWMRSAFEEDTRGEYLEVAAIVHILKVLPVNQELAKTTGIGQLIKELKSKKIAVKEIEALKVAWKEYLARQRGNPSTPTSASTSSTPSRPDVGPVDAGILEAVRLKIFGKRGLPKELEEEEEEGEEDEEEEEEKERMAVTEPGIQEASARGNAGTSDGQNGANMVVEGAESESKKTKAPPAQGVLPPSKKPRPGLKIISVNALAEGVVHSPVSARNGSGSGSSASSRSNTGSRGTVGDGSDGGSSSASAMAAAIRESGDVGVSATGTGGGSGKRSGDKERVVIDMAEVARKRKANEDAATAHASSSSSRSSASSTLSSSQMAQPGVGGMKKRQGRRLQVVWADQVSGADSGALRQVQTFEVDKKGGRDVEKWKNKKSHKEREKRERMAEKDKVTSQRRETMHRTVEWIPPEKLMLSIQIRDREQVQSQEKGRQDSRLEDLIEVRYLDESLIPADPDDAPDALHPVPGAAPTQVVNVLQTAGATAFEDTLQNPSQRDDSMLVAGASSSGIMQASHTPSPTTNVMYGSIPSQLHGLEPALLQVISQDESRMMSLLNADGSINLVQVQQLRNSLQASSAPPPVLSLPPHVGVLPPPITPGGVVSTGRAGSRFSRSTDSSGSTSRFSSAAPPTVTAGLPAQMTEAPPTVVSAGQPQVTRMVPGVDAGRLNARKRTPCKWFLSPKGCQNGDACTFGHFAMPGQRK